MAAIFSLFLPVRQFQSPSRSVMIRSVEYYIGCICAELVPPS